MGKYTFTWEHTAQEVFVTGTFDDWRKTVKLDKDGDIFTKTVDLPSTHTQYKFVVDGNWCINESARKEDDGHGITNNVLLLDDFTDDVSPDTAPAAPAALSSAAPVASTAALAGAVPKVQRTLSSVPVPGAFPMTPAAETPGSEPQTFNISPIPATAGLGNPVTLAPGEPVPHPSNLTDNTLESTVKHDEIPEGNATSFGVAPIPATAGLGNPVHLAPGEPVPHTSTLTDNTIQSTVKHDKTPEDDEAQVLGVAPIPATAGPGNPIHLAPGEKVPDPSTLTSNTIDSTVKTDATSYEKSDALPPLDFTPQVERDARGGMFDLPPVSGNMIPESSLPMGGDAKVEKDPGVTIQSAAPVSTSALLAGQVPLEPRHVPETVTDSQEQAGVAPEAAANPEAVQEKEQVEQELKEKVPEAPAAADNSFISNINSNAKAGAAAAAAGITAGAGLFAGAIYAAKDKAADTLNGSATTTSDVKDKVAETVGLNGSATASDVPSRVVKSQEAAHVSPEASSNPEAIHEKSQVEQELLSEIPKLTDTGASAPAIAIPAVVSDSQNVAHASPEAAAFADTVTEKKAVEAELLKEIPKTNETGEAAPVVTAATTEFAPGPTAETPVVASLVPEVVAESQKEAHVSPEAAANPEAVVEKSAVETELLKEVSPVPATDATVPTPVPVADSTLVTTAAPVATQPVAALSDDALVDTKPLKSSSEPDALNAPASKPTQPTSSKPIDANTSVAFEKQEPTTTEQTKPTVTTGVETTTAESKSTALEAPVQDIRRDSDVSPKGTPATQSLASAATDDKKKKRRSIFGKLKDKLSSKN